MSPRCAASSRAFARFSVARTRRGLEAEDALGTRVEGAALEANEMADAARGDGEERVEPRAAEGHLLGGALHLHELAAAGHDDVHVHLGARVLGVAEVEHRLALQEGRHLVLERRRADHLGRPELDQHGALGVEQEVPGDGDRPELIGGAAVGTGHGAYRVFVSDGSPAARTRWSQLRLYSARPATMARAISSRCRESLSRRSSFGFVMKPISIRMAGIAAPPRT